MMKFKRVKQWYKDFNSSNNVGKSGLKFVFLMDNLIVFKAPSYLIDNSNNFEIEVDTYAKKTGKQLALTCAAMSILAWVVRQIIPNCAIHNLMTVNLTSQLDLILNIPYQTYAVCDL